MSQGTHCQISSRRDKFNDLLTSFGRQIEDWAKGKNKRSFPKGQKDVLYSHIQWKPIPPAVHPDHPPPETTSVIGHEMGLKLSPNEKHFTPWLIVKKSEMGKKRTTGKKRQKLANEDEEHDVGLGLFAARQFLVDDVITFGFDAGLDFVCILVSILVWVFVWISVLISIWISVWILVRISVYISV